MFALREIKKGEEITYNYSLTIAPTEWRMRCMCGAQNCRKMLGDVLSVPAKQLEYYESKGAIQRYMKGILKETKAGKYTMPKYEMLAINKLKKTYEHQ